MFWELSADKAGADNLVAISAANIGALDDTPNHIYYPYSQFDNVKNNMGTGPGGSNSTVQPTSTSTKPPTSTTAPAITETTSAPPTTTTATTTTATGGGCAGIVAWSSDIAYTAGQVVTYGGKLLLL
jgi:chitinase